jgi:hypothetical protein
MPRGPDVDDGPRRFIRKWLTFDGERPVRANRIWMLFATILILLAVSALLVLFGNQGMNP